MKGRKKMTQLSIIQTKTAADSFVGRYPEVAAELRKLNVRGIPLFNAAGNFNAAELDKGRRLSDDEDTVQTPRPRLRLVR